jgi:hypothetical protein
MSVLPNLNLPFSSNGDLSAPTKDQFLATNPIVPGTGTILCGGSVSIGHVWSIKFANGNLPGGSVTVQVTAGGADTLVSMVVKTAEAINKNSTLSEYGITASANVDNIDIQYASPVGNFSTITGSSTGSETFTVTAISGAQGAIIPLQDFRFSGLNRRMLVFRENRPVVLDYAQLANLLGQGQGGYR